MIYASGFTLEKIAAMQEHGIRGACKVGIPPSNAPDLEPSILQGNMGKNWFNCSPNSNRLCRMVLIWPLVSSYPCSFFRLKFQTNLPIVGVYWTYLVLRVYGVYAHSKDASVCLSII